MIYKLIDSNDALASVCEAARQHNELALDTEFVRIRTYYPQPGLIQMYDGDQVSLIDPLMITVWDPLVGLLTDHRILKYLHAGSEDLELFLNMLGTIPAPMLDTQILAAFCGHPRSCGFAAMVERLTGTVLDKSESRTDWLARPLTVRQCEYAAADVFYLLPVAQILREDAKNKGVLARAEDECALLCQRRSDILQPDEAFLEISQAWQLRPRQLAALKLLAAWRLTLAREKDRAVNFVVREEHLWQVARYLPDSLAELDHLGLEGREIRFHGRAMLNCVAQANALAPDLLPDPIANIIDHPHYRNAFKAIKNLVTQVSEDSAVSAELLASRRQINRLLSWYWQLAPGRQLPEMISGWRGDLMKTPLEALLQQY